VSLEHRVLGEADEVAEAELVLARHPGGVLGGGHRHPRRVVGIGHEHAPVAGRPADGHEAPGAADHLLGDVADAAVGGDHEVEGAFAEGVAQRLPEVGVADDALDGRRDEVGVVSAPVQDRHLVAALDEPVHQVRPRRAGPADHQRAHLATIPLSRSAPP
jgi:hypothetical protein